MKAPGRPLILSVSRRTDLVGWYPKRAADRILRRIEGLRTRWLYGTVFWTRFPRNLLRPPLLGLIERELDNVVVNLTVTGLGGTRLEPNVPPTQEVLACLPELVDLLGHPDRIRWRFDPLLYGHSSIESFGDLAEYFRSLGVTTCTFSFPAVKSLKGDLRPVYRAHGLGPWPSEEVKTSFLRQMARIARSLNMRLLSCAQPDNLARDPWIEPAQCIPLEVLQDLHPMGRAYPATKDPAQRRHCLCPASEDLGRYGEDPCQSGCVYCYSPAGGPRTSRTENGAQTHALRKIATP